MLERMPSQMGEIRTELKPMMRLALPLVIAELGWVFMGVVDTLMVGRLPDSAAAIGAVSLGSMVFYAVAVFAGSILLGLDTLVSQAHGARNPDDCHRSLWSGLHLTAVLTPLAMLAIWMAGRMLEQMGVNATIRTAAAPYIETLNYGLPPLFLYFGLRRYLQGVGAVRIIGFCLISANLVNLAGNWALVYGHLGLPAMGIIGSAWATDISRFYMAAVLVVYIGLAERRIFAVPLLPDFSRLWRLLKLGVPAAMHVGLETLVFTVATLLIARLTPEALAAHQIALNLASVTFMVPLGISSAAAVRVGHRIGAGDFAGAGRSGYAAIAIAAAFMACAALTFLLVPRGITRLYTADAGVIELSVSLLAVAAVFQLCDGVQVTSAGALRGMGDTHTAMVCNLVFYWMVGLPVGYLLCFRFGYGAAGIWAGLCLGLVLIGIVLLNFWRRKVRRLRGRQIPPAI